MSGSGRNRLNSLLYRFGGDRAAYLIAGIALFLGLVTAFGAFTLEDRPVCIPSFAGPGQPALPGQVIAGEIVDREEKVEGCKSVAIQIRGYSLPRFNADLRAFEEAKKYSTAEAILVATGLPARFQGLKTGTKLIVLFNPERENPLAFYFPESKTGEGGLDIGSDTRTDYTKQRIVLLIITIFLLFIGGAVILFLKYYPVGRGTGVSGVPLAASEPRNRRPKPSRVQRDPITGEIIE